MYDEVRAWVRGNVPDNWSCTSASHAAFAWNVTPAPSWSTAQASTSRLPYDTPRPDLRIANFGNVAPGQAAGDHRPVPRQAPCHSRPGDGWITGTTTTAAGRGWRGPPPSRWTPRPGCLVSLVLEIGCGNGRDSVHLTACGHDVVGIDPRCCHRPVPQAHAASSAEFRAGRCRTSGMSGAGVRRPLQPVRAACHDRGRGLAFWRTARDSSERRTPGDRVSLDQGPARAPG